MAPIRRSFSLRPIRFMMMEPRLFSLERAKAKNSLVIRCCGVPSAVKASRRI
ncbi:hypothetical protein D3C87_2136320 [compost metagenome]